MKLVHPLFSDEALVFLARLIVQYLEVNIVSLGLEPTHQCVLFLKAVLVLPRFECTVQNCIPGAVITNHDLLVATTASDGEHACFICVYLTDVHDKDVKLVCFVV